MNVSDAESNMKSWLSCVRPKGDAGKHWRQELKKLQDFRWLDSDQLKRLLEFFTEIGEQADLVELWSSKQAKARYFACVQVLDDRWRVKVQCQLDPDNLD